jgi:hypothetical protein
MAQISIVRHVKIRADATPYSSEYQDYFKDRQKKKGKHNRGKASVTSKNTCSIEETPQQRTGSQQSFIKA